MDKIRYEQVQAKDNGLIQLIAAWYQQEWNIPTATTVQKLSAHPDAGIPFQVIMKNNGQPIGTGGVYTRVGIADHKPELAIYSPWLALVFTQPDLRGKGYGAQLCLHIEQTAKNYGLTELFLFTHTAESLYKRIGWTEMQRIQLGERNIAIMKKIL